MAIFPNKDTPKVPVMTRSPTWVEGDVYTDPSSNTWVKGNVFIDIFSIIIPLIATLGAVITSILYLTGTLNGALYSKIVLGFLASGTAFTLMGLLTDREANRPTRILILITFVALTVFASLSLAKLFSPTYLPVSIFSLKTFGFVGIYAMRAYQK